MNLVALIVSAGLGALALTRLKCGNASKRRLAILFPWVLALHFLFARPVLFNTLSDAPAGMFLLIGLWTLVLGSWGEGWRPLAWLATSGLALGMAVWIRAFFLVPVGLGLAFYCSAWALRSPRRAGALLPLLALGPIGTQYAVMWATYGSLTFLSPDKVTSWTDVHLGSPVVGYDTVFPHDGYAWEPKHCHAAGGIRDGFEQGDWPTVACLVSERIYFYLGTYEPDNYLFGGATNRLVRSSAASVGDPADWYTEGVRWEPDVVAAPDGLRRGDRLSAEKGAAPGDSQVIQWTTLRGGTMHTLSVWLWSPLPRSLSLSITQRDGPLIATRRIELTPTPTRYSVSGVTRETGLYDLTIGRSPQGVSPVTFGSSPGDFYLAWGAQIEEGPVMTPYRDNAEVIPADSVRRWRPWLLVLNLFVATLAAVGILRGGAFWFKSAGGLGALAIAGASALEAVAIIPEQRFAVSLMIFMWSLSLVGLFDSARLQIGRKPTASGT